MGLIVGGDDRIYFPPLRLWERHGETVVDLVAGLRQHSRHDARPERDAIDADARADLHTLALPIRKNRYNKAFVAIDKRRTRVPCIHMLSVLVTHIHIFSLLDYFDL